MDAWRLCMADYDLTRYLFSNVNLNTTLFSLRLNKTAGRGEQAIKRQSNTGEETSKRSSYTSQTKLQQLRKHLNN
jgi:hypothetical protein